MPYATQWYIPDRVVYTQYAGHVSAEDIDDVVLAMKQYLAAGTPPIHHIVDFLAAESMAERQQEGRPTLSPVELSRHGWAVIVSSASAYIRFRVFTMAQAAGVRYQEVASFDDALTFLMRADESLQEADDNTE